MSKTLARGVSQNPNVNHYLVIDNSWDLRHANLPVAPEPSLEMVESEPHDEPANFGSESDDLVEPQVNSDLHEQARRNNILAHDHDPPDPARSFPIYTRKNSITKPLSPVSTGSSTTSPGKWRPPQLTICPACQKPVYFAEQVLFGHFYDEFSQIWRFSSVLGEDFGENLA